MSGSAESLGGAPNPSVAESSGGSDTKPSGEQRLASTDPLNGEDSSHSRNLPTTSEDDKKEKKSEKSETTEATGQCSEDSSKIHGHHNIEDQQKNEKPTTDYQQDQTDDSQKVSSKSSIQSVQQFGSDDKTASPKNAGYSQRKEDSNTSDNDDAFEDARGEPENVIQPSNPNGSSQTDEVPPQSGSSVDKPDKPQPNSSKKSEGSKSRKINSNSAKPKISRDIFQGQECLELKFNAILHQSWSYTDSSIVQLNFNHPQLEQYVLGDCKPMRTLLGRKQHLPISISLKLPIHILQYDKLSYSYVFYHTPQSKSNSEVCYIDDPSIFSPNFKRILTMPPGPLRKECVYNVYDGIILPAKGLWKAITFTSLPTYAEQQVMALKSYFQFLQLKIDDWNNGAPNLKDFTSTIEDIYSQIRHKHFRCSSERKQRVVDLRNLLAEKLCSLPDDKAPHPVIQTCSFLSAIYLIKKFQLWYFLSRENTLNLLKLAAIDTRRVEPLQFKQELFDFTKETIGEVESSLIMLINHHLGLSNELQWLFGLSLLNIIQSYMKPGSTQQEIRIDHRIHIPKWQCCQWFDDEMIMYLKRLSQVDPLILHQAQYFVLPKQVHVFFDGLKSTYSMKYLSTKVEEMASRDEIQMIKSSLKKILDVVKNENQQWSTGSFEGALTLLKSCLMAMKEETLAKSKPIIHICFTITLCVLQNNISPTTNYDTNIDWNEISLLCYILENMWLIRFQVPQEGMENEEIKEFLKLSKIDCPKNITPLWHKKILDVILQSRLSNMSLILRIQLLKSFPCDIDHYKTVIYEDIENGFRKMESVTIGALQLLYAQLNEHQSIVGPILNDFFCNKYPQNDDFRLKFKNLLVDLEFWLFFLSLYKKEQHNKGDTKYIVVLNEYCIKLCGEGYALQEDMINRCRHRSITFLELNLLLKHKEEFNALCMQYLENAEEVKLFNQQFAVVQNDSNKLSSIQISLKLLYDELTQVLPQVKGLDILQRIVNETTHDQPISDQISSKIERTLSTQQRSVTFYFKDEGKPIRFELESGLVAVACKYSVFIKNNSIIFHKHIWKSLVEKLKEDVISIDDIEDTVWKLVIQECEQLLTSIETKTIKLRRVNDLLHLCQTDSENTIFQELTKLNTSIISDKQRVTELSEDINTSIKSMLAFEQQCKLVNEAKAILQVRSKLKITTNFRKYEKVAEILKDNMFDETLDFISGSTDVVDFLKRNDRNTFLYDILKCFYEHFDVIEWIRKEAKDIVNLQKFVNVALHTATGDGDLEYDKLSNLKEVASAYEPLIFIKSDSTEDEFETRCDEVWNTVEKNPHLIKTLKSCNEQWQWFVTYKKNLGSMEKNSIEQMENILNCGVYYIGSEKRKIYTNIAEIFYLKLFPDKYKRDDSDKSGIIKVSYSLNDVRDLESKLVLITGSKAEYKDKFKLFLNILQGTSRIAEVLLQLQQVGYVNFIGWIIQIPIFIDQNTIVDILNETAKAMEMKLNQWNDKLRKARKDFYELNYYTTLQLLILREKIKSENDTITPDILAILQNMSPNVTAVIAQRAIHSVPFRVQDCHLHGKATAKSRTADQTLVIQKIKAKYGYDEDLIIKAMDEINEATEDGIVEWCLKAEYSDDSETSSDESIDSVPKETASGHAEIHSSQCEIHPKVKTKYIKVYSPINEYHWIVQKLLRSDFSVEEIIDAVEKTGAENDELAHNYLIKKSLGEQIKISMPKNTEVMKISAEMNNTNSLIVYSEEEPDSNYLSLEILGTILKKIKNLISGKENYKRPFTINGLKEGEPNLLIVNPDQLWKAILYLYMNESEDNMPLPTQFEVQICNPTTKTEEIEIFWNRAIREPNNSHIFCLVHAEVLSKNVCETVLDSLFETIEENKDSKFRLVIIHSNENEASSLLISKLQHYRRLYILEQDLKPYRSYLKRNLKYQGKLSAAYASSTMEQEGSCVLVVTSSRCGMGKTHYIKNLEAKIMPQAHKNSCLETIPIHGPVVTSDTLMEFFIKFMKNPSSTIFHIDLASSALPEAGNMLFSLLVLHQVSGSNGYIWQCSPEQLYVVEVVLPKSGKLSRYSSASLLKLLPTVDCNSPQYAYKNDNSVTLNHTWLQMDEKVFFTEHYQRVYQYLNLLFENKDVTHFVYNNQVTEGDMHNCLKLLLYYCGIPDPSWTELTYFVKFLSHQLELCENSIYISDPEFIKEVLVGIKKFSIEFFIQMSRDFSTSSLQGEIAANRSETVIAEEDIMLYDIPKRAKWEQRPHPYLFFNKDGYTLTFVGFVIKLNQDTNMGDLYNSVNEEIVKSSIISKDLLIGFESNKVNLDDNPQLWSKEVMLKKLATVMGIENVEDPDKSYVLTVDNVIKILAIQMRFRCGIPVVIMGDTGCGKTRLIRYMCNIARNEKNDINNMLILKVHGGTTKKDIVNFIKTVQKIATQNEKHGVDTIAFFDEANTTEYVSLFKEILCDRRIDGKQIPSNIKFIAACNPYKKHAIEMIKNLQTAGLGYYVKETKNKLGSVPLRELVYRVYDLPLSIRPLVFDFGQLNDKTESLYTRQIIENNISGHTILKDYIQPISKILCDAQAYMRKQKDECSYVSLRDIERAIKVFQFFYEKTTVFTKHIEIYAKEKQDKVYNPLNDIVTAIIMMLHVCYQIRLKERKSFLASICESISKEFNLLGIAQFTGQIKWYEEVMLHNMEVGPNIARNTALLENVFIMAVCVELRIPLFLIGKPGSSKSLAKSIISNSMLGKHSKNDFLKNFKEVTFISCQCSHHITASSIMEAFRTAKKIQKDSNLSECVATVVLDEVGLAEDSPELPLKVLHPLLEDGHGGESTDYSDKVIDQIQRVAFIGISNWALDPAKMNRGIMVNRPDLDEEELETSAEEICSKDSKLRLLKFLKPLSLAYIEVCKKQTQEFFGLRDFYSLIKMLDYECQKCHDELTWQKIEHCIRRNFGGKKIEGKDPYVIYEDSLLRHCSLIQPAEDLDSSSQLNLIKSSLSPSGNKNEEQRYLLLLTENYSALKVLKSPRKYLQLGINDDYEGQKRLWILFGSFPKDKEYTQICSFINRIKICMETGCTVVLLDLENLYASLYDVLNQYYFYYNNSKYVDLGLKTHRVRCRVADEFRIILIAEKNTVYEKFPTPLINRLEKHFVMMSSVLDNWQKVVLQKLKDWINCFSSIRDSSFKENDSFVLYQEDVPATILLQATNWLESAQSEYSLRLSKEEMPNNVLKIFQYSGLREDQYGIQNNDLWISSVFELSKFLLIQTSCPDAIIRLEKSLLKEEVFKIQKMYFEEQHHMNLKNFLHHCLEEAQQTKLLMQVTTHSAPLTKVEINNMKLSTNPEIHAFSLHQFDTEAHFSNRMIPLFQKPEEDCIRLIIIQCDSGHLNGDLISCAQHYICEYRDSASKEQMTHVLFTIHLPRNASSSSLGIKGENWICVHIDTLNPSENDIVANGQSKAISDIFVNSEKPLFKRMFKYIQPAVSRLTDYTTKRSTDRVQLLLKLIPKENVTDDEETFYSILIKHIYDILIAREKNADVSEKSNYTELNNWILTESMNSKALLQGGTFCNALSKRVDRVIVQVFAEILSVIDQNSNLDLINYVDETSSLNILWCSIFSKLQVMEHQWLDFVGEDDYVPGCGARKGTKDYKCSFPFSWLIFEVIERQFERLKPSGTNFEMCIEMSKIIKKTPLDELFQDMTGMNFADLYSKYLNDFVCIVHHSKLSEDYAKIEMKIVQESLDLLLNKEVQENNDGSMVNKILLLHTVYKNNKSSMQLFSELVSVKKIGLIILNQMADSMSSEMTDRTILHLYGVEKAIQYMTLEKNFTIEDVIEWFKNVSPIFPIITHILSIASDSSLRDSLRIDWNYLRSKHLFIQHIILKHHDADIKVYNNFDMIISKKKDYSKCETIDSIVDVVKWISKKRISIDATLLQRNCTEFFLDVISSLCFQSQSSPSEKIIELLMSKLVKGKKTGDLSPFPKHYNDEIPTVHSTLFQLLIKLQSTDVQHFIEDYLTMAIKIASNTEKENICNFFIRCFENAFQKNIAMSSCKTKHANETLKSLHCELKHDCKDQMTVPYFQTVAKTRVALQEVVKSLSNVHFENSDPREIDDILNCAEDICTMDEDLNSPGGYFLLSIIKNFGYDFLDRLIQRAKWIIPASFSIPKMEKEVDPFTVYNDLEYSEICKKINSAFLDGNMEELRQETQRMTSSKVPLLLLGIYRNITVKHPYSEAFQSHFSDIEMEEFVEIFRDTKVLTAGMLKSAKLLFFNDLIGPMKMTSQTEFANEFLSYVVVHTYTTISSFEQSSFLQPLYYMAHNPSKLATLFLPTMLEDKFEKVQDVDGHFYKCPNNHLYFMKKEQILTCPICQLKIGTDTTEVKPDHKFTKGCNTMTGYNLGDSSARSISPTAPIRCLSSSAVCIFRAIMHSAFIWFASSNKEHSEGFDAIIQPQQDDYLSFFWDHLRKDIQQLSSSINRNMFEASIVVHHVLKTILIKGDPHNVDTTNLLHTRESLYNWEQAMNDHYIQPVLQDIMKYIDDTMEVIACETTEENDLLKEVYKKKAVPSLWNYEQELTLEWIMIDLRKSKKQNEFPLLHQFIVNETMLRATQYLPDIVKLQLSLYDKYNYRMDRKKAMKLTIEDFLQELENDNSKNNYKRWINSLQKAWDLVGVYLKKHGRIPVEEHLWISKITQNTSMEYIIPTTSNAGVCTTALVDYLTLTHNEFVKTCHTMAHNMEGTLREVPINQLSEYHILQYEKEIMPLILSHCHYSLPNGEAYTTSYNYQAIENGIFQNFILGKPLIQLDIPQVVYRTDVHTVATFESVRIQVKGQVVLDLQIRKEIKAELDTPDRLRTNLDLINIVLGFLASGGGDPDMKMKDYIKNVLKMQRRSFSRQILECCQLKHILSLWQTLSVELSRLICLKHHEPFDTMQNACFMQLSEAQEADLDASFSPTLDLNELLGSFHEYIETSVRYSPNDELQLRLADVLVEHKHRNLMLPDEFMRNFPKSIVVAQAIAVWKHIVHYQETHTRH